MALSKRQCGLICVQVGMAMDAGPSVLQTVLLSCQISQYLSFMKESDQKINFWTLFMP
jgi:hypothetical protein